MFSVYIPDFARLTLACFALVLIVFYTYDYYEGKWDNKCPCYTTESVTVYILPKKHCRISGQPC